MNCFFVFFSFSGMVFLCNMLAYWRQVPSENKVYKFVYQSRETDKLTSAI